MSGHSKWATIKRKKGALDAKRGAVFTKIIKEIMVSARMGGSSVEGNARLRMAVLKAKAANMPKDNIDRAIKKGAGELEGQEFVELSYEAYAPGGVAILIETLTDNKNRTAADVRMILTKGNGQLATVGSVTRLFDRKGYIVLDGEKTTEDAVMEIALEAGAEDIVDNGNIEVTTAPADFEKVLEAINKAGLATEMAEVSLIPQSRVAPDKETAEKIMNLIDRLEENDDVQNVYHNLDTSILDDGEEE
jgi:YebC/PmpR family DNA-binding regulatory protein